MSAENSEISLHFPLLKVEHYKSLCAKFAVSKITLPLNPSPERINQLNPLKPLQVDMIH